MVRPKREQARGHDEMVRAVKSAAWQQMAAAGTAGLSLRGIARELGVTPATVYHYFDRLEGLITALIVDAFTSLAEAMEAADAATVGDRPADHIAAIAEAYRGWALQQPVGFQLIYGNPIPGYEAPSQVTAPLALRGFLGMFKWYAAASEAGALVVPDTYEHPPAAVRSVLARLVAETGFDISEQLAALLAAGWARIHGLIMLELFNHLQPLVGDPAAFYSHEVAALLVQLGMDRPAGHADNR